MFIADFFFMAAWLDGCRQALDRGLNFEKVIAGWGGPLIGAPLALLF